MGFITWIVIVIILWLLYKYLKREGCKTIVEITSYIPKEQRRKTYEDKRSYIRYKDNRRLVHREIAYEFIYCMQGYEEYPLRFKEYDVHHIDGNKRNNSPDNLQILTREEHKEKHGIKS